MMYNSYNVVCYHSYGVTKCYNPLTHLVSSDIGHVDFLEAVHRLAEKPYIIVGLHFDQVSDFISFFFFY